MAVGVLCGVAGSSIGTSTCNESATNTAGQQKCCTSMESNGYKSNGESMPLVSRAAWQQAELAQEPPLVSCTDGGMMELMSQRGFKSQAAQLEFFSK